MHPIARHAVLATAAALFALLCGTPALADLSPEAQDRGRLSLAWDAHESGLWEEALQYAAEVSPGSPSAPEALWLRGSCLKALKRYAEAAALLESPAGRAAENWAHLAREVFEAWAWEATDREDYAQAAAIAERGLGDLADDTSLRALRAASLFRQELWSAVGSPAAASGVRLSGGEEVAVRRLPGAPQGRNWLRAFPWNGEVPWVPEITLDDWMPTLADRLRREGKGLWLRIPGAALDRAVFHEAERRRAHFNVKAGGYLLTVGEDRIDLDREEWAYLAAAEGLGARGAALSAVADAVSALESCREMARWVVRNAGPLDVKEEGSVLRLQHPATGRVYELDLHAWATSQDIEAEEWREFWSDLVAELGRKADPFRCFCGREALLRETLASDAGDALVVEKGSGYSLVLTALCPLHQQYVTAKLLASWGVDLEEALGRARLDARERPWELFFERGEEGGTPYVALQGEGVSSLARRPDLLLGALEAIEGSEVRGRSVQVLAPTGSSLVVVEGKVPIGKAQAAANRALLRGARRGEAMDRLGYRTMLRLPPKASGVFEVHSTEEP